MHKLLDKIKKIMYIFLGSFIDRNEVKSSDRIDDLFRDEMKCNKSGNGKSVLFPKLFFRVSSF